MEYIDIKLISPVSKTNLDGKYLLIAVKHDKLYKHTINLQNATPKQSLYKCETTIPIKSLVLLFKIDNTTYTLMFMGHATNNKIKLKEIYYKSTNYTDDFDLLSEKFFSNVVYQDGYVMLFGYLANYNTDKYDKHSELKITDNIYLYNIKLDILMREDDRTKNSDQHSIHMKDIYYYLDNFDIIEPKEIIDEYGINTLLYENLNWKNMTEYYQRTFKKGRGAIAMTGQRKLELDNYNFNFVSNPTDSRTTVFNNTKDLILAINDYEYSIEDLLRNTKIDGLYKGSGFICRTTIVDYPVIISPFSGYITNVYVENKKGLLSNEKTIVLRISNEYYIPKEVKERAYLSVVYGRQIDAGAIDSSLVNKQPRMLLIYYIVITSNGQIMFNKLTEYTNNATDWKSIRPLYIEKGEHLGRFLQPSGVVGCFFNRQLLWIKTEPYEKKLNMGEIVGYLT